MHAAADEAKGAGFYHTNSMSGGHGAAPTAGTVTVGHVPPAVRADLPLQHLVVSPAPEEEAGAEERARWCRSLLEGWQKEMTKRALLQNAAALGTKIRKHLGMVKKDALGDEAKIGDMIDNLSVTIQSYIDGMGRFWASCLGATVRGCNCSPIRVAGDYAERYNDFLLDISDLFADEVQDQALRKN